MEDGMGPSGGREEGTGLRPGAARRKPRVLDLFSGIGGFALAFEAAGCETVAFAEIEPYPCKVLAQHWPEVPNLGDVRAIDGEAYRGAIDVVCGGFPCQDISGAGRGAGLEGARSGLWYEMLRIIEGARPAFCLIENVPALRSRGIDRVLDGLEGAGYAARPFNMGAWALGAAHKRDRLWLVAYAKSFRGEARAWDSGAPEEELVFAGLRAAPLRPWTVEPCPPGVADGVPSRAHRLKALGNSIVPAVAYPFCQWIYNVLMARSAPAKQGSPSSPSPETSK